MEAEGPRFAISRPDAYLLRVCEAPIHPASRPATATVGPGIAIDDLSDQKMEISMTANISETAKDVVRRNTEEVQGRGNWALFDELFADNFFDHTPQPGGTRDKACLPGFHA